MADRLGRNTHIEEAGTDDRHDCILGGLYLSSAAAAPVSAQPGEVDVVMAKAGFEFQNRASLEMFKSVIEAGRTTLNALILMNGGAAVALLAFLGNAITKAPADPRLQLHGVSFAMLLFVLGVGFAGA